MYGIGSIPLMKVKVRKQYLYNLEKGFGEYDDAMVFGVTCAQGRAPVFHAMMPNGAIYYRMPLMAFCTDEKASELTSAQTYFWDSFSYYFTVHRYAYLRDMDCNVWIKDDVWRPGSYKFTIDWVEPDGDIPLMDCEIPDEHKCHHIIELEDGNFVAYPNNRILWKEASFVVRDEIPDYKTNTTIWYGEEGFKTENSDRQFYKTQEESSEQ
jgi:hypothetical protein